MNTGNVIVFITTADNQEATKISEALLNQKKAACINTITEIKSRYWWQGQLDEAWENLLIVKTTVELLNDVITITKNLHSYRVPEIIAIPVVGGNPEYLQWIKDETS